MKNVIGLFKWRQTLEGISIFKHKTFGLTTPQGRKEYVGLTENKTFSSLLLFQPKKQSMEKMSFFLYQTKIYLAKKTLYREKTQNIKTDKKCYTLSCYLNSKVMCYTYCIFCVFN